VRADVPGSIFASMSIWGVHFAGFAIREYAASVARFLAGSMAPRPSAGRKSDNS
jgi:hypothetical protein